MSTLYTEKYADLYRELLESVKGMEQDGATAYHMCCYGKDYLSNLEKRFMVIGQDLNGWGDNIGRSIEDEMQDAMMRKEPYDMQFIHTQSKSKFWSITKKVVEGLDLSGTEEDDWFINLAWSNLYKVARQEESSGHPKEKVFTAQFISCNKIIKYEITTLQPRFILLITGQWFCDFNYGKKGRKKVEPNDILPLNIQQCTNCSNKGGNSIVIEAKNVAFDGFFSKVVICQRPERRSGNIDEFTEDIINAFKSL